MGDFGAVTDGGVLHLHKVAHLDVVPDGAAGAHVGKGPHVGAAADGALVHLGGIDLCLIADDAIPHHGIGTDGAAAADGGLPPQDGAGQEHGPPADGDPGVDIHRVRVQHPDAGADVPPDDPLPEQGLQLGHGLQTENRHPAGDQLRRGDGIGHLLLPDRLELVAGGAVDKAGARLLHGKGGPDKHGHRVRRVQKVQQLAVLLRDGHVCVLREAGADLLGKAGAGDSKKPLHAVGQQLVTHPF